MLPLQQIESHAFEGQMNMARSSGIKFLEEQLRFEGKLSPSLSELKKQFRAEGKLPPSPSKDALFTTRTLYGYQQRAATFFYERDAAAWCR